MNSDELHQRISTASGIKCETMGAELTETDLSKVRPRNPSSGDLVQLLFAEFVFFGLSSYSDEDGPANRYTFHGTTHEGRPVRVVRDSALACVQAALGIEPRKVCRGCGQEKLLGGFSKSARARDGRLARCKLCEAARVKLYESRRALEQARG